MKKVIVLAMVAMLTFSIAGCGKKADGVGTEAASQNSEAMDKYIELSQASFDAMTESLKGVMEFKASGEGNTLKYEMKVLADMGDAETAKTQVDAQMEAQKEQMQMVVEGLKEAGVENPKFIVEYKDKDDNVIATYDFE